MEGQKVAIHKLSESKIAKLTKDTGDGGGLWLQVRNNGNAKSWIFRWTERGTGRERNLGLGPLHTINLEEAREMARRYRKLLLQGEDPKAERDNTRLDDQIAQDLVKKVSQVADEYFDAKIAQVGQVPQDSNLPTQKICA
jgi:hypothetical protein